MPEDKLDVSQRISTQLAQGQNSQARAEIENLLRDWPGDAEVFTLAGDVYAWTGAPSTAYRHYNSAADSFNRLGMPDKMLSVHHKILEIDATLLDANTQVRIRLLELLVAAEDALISGRYEVSVAKYQEAIRQFPNHTVTYQRLASLFTRMGRNADAVAQYLTVARAFHQHGVAAKATPYFERVLELEPAHVEALDAVLDYFGKEGRLAEAEKPLKSAVQGFLGRGEVDHAAAYFQRLPESVQQDVTPLRAALLLQMGDIQQSEDAAKMLDLGSAEVSEWFKGMGRAALDRGDSVTADIYFKWANPVAVAVPAAVPAPVLPPPVQMAPPPPPPPVPVPVPAPAAAPALVQFVAPLQADSIDVKAEDDRVVLQTMGEMCLAEEMFEEAKQVFERLLRAEPHRKGYLELLNKSRAGLGLGPVSGPPPLPGSVPAPPPPAAAAPAPAPLPPPAPPVAATVLGAPAFKAPVLAPPPPPPAPAPVVLAPPPPLAPPAPAPVPLVITAPAPPPLPVLAPPPAPLAIPAPPVLEPVGHRSAVGAHDGPHQPLPVVEWANPAPPGAPFENSASLTATLIEKSKEPAPAKMAKLPVLMSVGSATPEGAKIVRTSHTLQLGELPPAMLGKVDYDDDIIE